jgi:glutathione S-transferase
MPMTLTIHGFPISTYVRTARMTCVEKNVDYQLDPIPPDDCKARGLHPFGKVPAMDHDGFKLFESGAICRYIDAAFQGPALLPADIKARALMDQWISVAGDALYDVMIRKFVLQYVFAKDGKPDRSVIDPAIGQIREQLGVLDRAYGARDFVVGDSLTLADLFLAPLLFYVGKMPEGGELLGAVPAVRRGIAAIETRKSCAETMPPMPG